MKRLTLVAADEAHTIWGWTFRKQFRQIGYIRTALPNVPFAAFSATFPPHVVGYVQKVCRMKLPSDIITVNGRRRNINILVTVQPSRTSYDPLLDLIPTTAEEMSSFPKSLIFVDSVLEARRLAIALREKFQSNFPGIDSWRTIRTYYSSIDDQKKEATIRLFRNGEAQMTIATDAMSLGVDISDIERVIQWGVTERLTLDTLVQRIGRAARLSSMLGVAVIYTPRDLLDPVSAAREKAFNQVSPDDVPLNPPDDDDWEDIIDAVPRYADRDLSIFALPVEPETISQVQEMRLKVYRHVNKLKDAAREEDSERKASKRGVDGNTKKKQPIDKIEPGIIWFLNTTGCRHRCILEYMRFPDVFEDHKQLSWCCDNCAIRKGQTILMPGGYPLPPPASLRSETKRTTVTKIDWNVINNGAPPRENYDEKVEQTVQDILKAWRKHIYDKLVNRGVLSKFLPEQVVLSDRAIVELVSKQNLKHVTTVNGLRTTLTKVKVDTSSNMLREKDINEMYGMIERVFELIKVESIVPNENTD
jgi:Helicase conserved C-terminal domain